MRARLVQIGISRGIAIPKTVVRECWLEDEVEIQIHKQGLQIRPASWERKGWAEAYQRMARAADDRLIGAGSRGETDWDRRDRKW